MSDDEADLRGEAHARLAEHELERAGWVLDSATSYGWPEHYLPEMARFMVAMKEAQGS